MQNRQSGRRRRGGSSGNNPRPMGMASGGQGGSNRLEVRVRGNANQLLEKYKVLARDAHQAGDRVATEYYLQHADHYFRVLNDSRIRQEEMRSRRGPFDQLDDDFEDDADTQDAAGEGGNADDGERTSERNGQDRGQDQGNRRPRDDRRFEGRSDRPQRDGERPQRDGDRPQRWQQDGRGQEGRGQEGRGQDGQRENQAREGQVREAQGRDGQGRDGQAREYQGRANGNHQDSEGRARYSDGEGRARPDAAASRLRQDAADGRGQADERAAMEAENARMSDGEAALAAFGGAPAREPARAILKANSAAEAPVEDFPAADAPAPRKRGRPRKVDAAPAAEG